MEEYESYYAGWENSMANDDMLIGRADRDRYMTHLSKMYADDYLTHEEFQGRTDAVAKARTLRELKATSTDLPPAPQELSVPEKPGEFYSHTLNDAAKLAGKVPEQYWALGGMLVSLGTAIGAPVYFSSFFGGFGHINGPALVISILAIVLGSISALVTGIVALIIAVDG